MIEIYNNNTNMIYYENKFIEIDNLICKLDNIELYNIIIKNINYINVDFLKKLCEYCNVRKINITITEPIVLYDLFGIFGLYSDIFKIYNDVYATNIEYSDLFLNIHVSGNHVLENRYEPYLKNTYDKILYGYNINYNKTNYIKRYEISEYNVYDFLLYMKYNTQLSDTEILNTYINEDYQKLILKIIDQINKTKNLHNLLYSRKFEYDNTIKDNKEKVKTETLYLMEKTKKYKNTYDFISKFLLYNNFNINNDYKINKIKQYKYIKFKNVYITKNIPKIPIITHINEFKENLNIKNNIMGSNKIDDNVFGLISSSNLKNYIFESIPIKIHNKMLIDTLNKEEYVYLDEIIIKMNEEYHVYYYKDINMFVPYICPEMNKYILSDKKYNIGDTVLKKKDYIIHINDEKSKYFTHNIIENILTKKIHFIHPIFKKDTIHMI